MKVLCIDDKLRPNEMYIPGCELKEGETYTVVEEVTGYDINSVTGFSTNPRQCYVLAEFAAFPGVCFETNRFVPLSEIDETTFERNYQKELV